MAITSKLDETINENSIMTLSCSSMGVPKPSLEWQYEELPLSRDNDSIAIFLTSSGSNSMSTLKRVNVPLNASGIYICVATNSVDSIRTSTTITIMSKLYSIALFLVVIVCASV